MKRLSWSTRFCRTCGGERPHDKRTLQCHGCRTVFDPTRPVARDSEAAERTPLPTPLALFPTTPPSNGNPNSDAAAAALTADDLDTKQRAVLACIWRHREHGITDQRIHEVTGLGENTVRPRRNELWEGGWIVARVAETGAEIGWHDDPIERGKSIRPAEKGLTRSNSPATLWFPSARAVRLVRRKAAA